MTLNVAAIRKRAQRAHPTMTQCEKCASTERLSRHHPDYSKPEEIVVLCSACHPRMDTQDGTRSAKKPKVCVVCGTTFTHYSHSRVKCCSKDCLSELGRRNAQKRWGNRGSTSPTSPASPTESPSASTDCGPSATRSSRRSRSGSAGASSITKES